MITPACELDGHGRGRKSEEVHSVIAYGLPKIPSGALKITLRAASGAPGIAEGEGGATDPDARPACGVVITTWVAVTIGPDNRPEHVECKSPVLTFARARVAERSDRCKWSTGRLRPCRVASALGFDREAFATRCRLSEAVATTSSPRPSGSGGCSFSTAVVLKDSIASLAWAGHGENRCGEKADAATASATRQSAIVTSATAVTAGSACSSLSLALLSLQLSHGGRPLGGDGACGGASCDAGPVLVHEVPRLHFVGPRRCRPA